MEEEEKIVKGDDDVELDATLEDLYMGGSLKVCEQCPNVKYEREGYFFIAVDGQVQALVGYEETIKHLDEHLVDISTKGVTKPKEVRKFKGILLDGRRVSISGPLALSCEALALRKACLMGKALHLSGIQLLLEHFRSRIALGPLVATIYCSVQKYVRIEKNSDARVKSLRDIEAGEGDSRSLLDAFFFGKPKQKQLMSVLSLH
ncbi:hypothetical protein RHMOL_Rhmol01G0343400 [Rhododendron molle]|uniref:Uncharacterized protein n=1 Tax=Rhododendron molle TaxID=49168 RepID=A0ACC0Q8F9_RHOML|nr:hypothetical protein RHMOL_Rhmol01G0343400 [Rhododendron molle]